LPTPRLRILLRIQKTLDPQPFNLKFNPILRKQNRENRNRSLQPSNLRNSVPITYTSHEQVEVYRFSAPAAVLIPLLAVFLQAFVPLRLHFFAIFDLPLLVVIFFGVARRNPVSGMLTGAAIGILQDALTPSLPIGVFGIANTVVGYGASSLGAKIDVDNMASRFLVTIFFCLVHEIAYFTVASGLVAITVQWNWAHELGSAFANAVLAVGMFALLDRFKQRT
jgi:rod shape-determining protein MreD